MPHFLIVTVGLYLVLIAAPAVGFAQLTIDADSQYRYAQSRLDSGAVDEAIAEFNRFIHFFPADPRVPRAHFQTGMAHFSAGQYQAAAAIFNRQTVDFTGSPLDNQAYFMLSRSHARQGMIERAILDLHNLVALSSASEVIDRARYELGWFHVDQGRWTDAEQAFGHISPDNQDRFQVADLMQALAHSDAIPVKSPTTAGFLSIVPGGGQLYCNRYQDAATAFLINAGLIWAAWEAFDNEQYALGSVISFVEFGFYAGNIYGAVSSAHKYNRDRITEYRQRLNQRRQMSLSLAPTPEGAALRLTVRF
ncbi:tetratricopeptide repeat protein [Desulfosarcina sp.]|uniref:tetratricopeptide repeat protein n=1 Tax=Desulfosarcina sp. TaxID=2027861 RepID=UPI0029B99C3F|nr:tetratricopeptide repeat protein [Desulfosarcina sp.]MDX2451171.1 tetratricopeptide repeat protein [Desulfosarcina sp.]MDX2489010.1 tetratricopeptide repeat protein [Desulfosarcina sp.]